MTPRADGWRVTVEFLTQGAALRLAETLRKANGLEVDVLPVSDPLPSVKLENRIAWLRKFVALEPMGERAVIENEIDLITQAVNEWHALHNEMLRALCDLREASTEAYKSGHISAEPFVRAGNVIAKAEATL